MKSYTKPFCKVVPVELDETIASGLNPGGSGLSDNIVEDDWDD